MKRSADLENTYVYESVSHFFETAHYLVTRYSRKYRELEEQEDAVLARLPATFVDCELEPLRDKTYQVAQTAIIWQAYFCAIRWFYEAIKHPDTTITADALQSVLDNREHNHPFTIWLAEWEAGWRKWMDALPIPHREEYEPHFRDYQRLLLEQAVIISYMVAYIAFRSWMDLSVIDDTVTINPSYGAALDELIQQRLDLTADIKEIRSGVGWTSVG